jgi:hypothetical protein
VLKYRWFQKMPWQEEIKRMLASGLKYEIDAPANKDFRYLTKTICPESSKRKIGWISASSHCSSRTGGDIRGPVSQEIPVPGRFRSMRRDRR